MQRPRLTKRRGQTCVPSVGRALPGAVPGTCRLTCSPAGDLVVAQPLGRGYTTDVGEGSTLLLPGLIERCYQHLSILMDPADLIGSDAVTTAEVYAPTPPTIPVLPREDASSDVGALRQRRRDHRYELLRWQWAHSSLDRLHHCRLHTTSGSVALLRGAESAYLSGLQTCGSIWSCPLCSAVIRTKRAKRIEDSVKSWVGGGEGRWVAFLTLTVRHHRRDSLRDVYGGLSEAWRYLRQLTWWRSLDWAGFWRSTEITDGVNGWHPHVHLLLFGQGDRDLAAIGRELAPRWQAAVERAGMEPTTLARGSRLQPVTMGGPSLGEYLSKVLDEDGGERDLANELARSDMKKSRRGRSPMQLLAAAANGDKTAAARWHEYEQATFGRRAIESSRGLAKLTGIDDVEDEDLAEDDEFGEMITTLDAAEYQLIARAGFVASILDAAETRTGPDAVEFIHALLRLLGSPRGSER